MDEISVKGLVQRISAQGPKDRTGRTMDEILAPLTSEEERLTLLPVAYGIRKAYWRFQDTRDEKERTYILEQIDALERTYRVMTGQVEHGGDWKLCEVFPGARVFYGKIMEGSVKDLSRMQHWHEDFVLIEYQIQKERTKKYKGLFTLLKKLTG